MIRLQTSRWAACLLMGWLVSLVTSPALHARSLDQALNDMAGKVHRYLQDQGEPSVTVDAFDGPAAASGGRRIQDELSKKLQSHGTEVKKVGLQSWVIDGNFQYQPLDNRGILLIRCELRDENGGPQNEFRTRVPTERVDNLTDLSELLGLTGDFTGDGEVDAKPPTTDAEIREKRTKLVVQRDATLTKSRKNPSFHLINTSVVAATEKSPYRLEVLVKRKEKYEPLEIGDLEGFAFAPLQEGDEYAVKIINDSDDHVGVRLSIDGLNSFVLSEVPAYKKNQMWVIHAHKRGLVLGWHRTDEDLFQFKITATPDSVAAKLGLPTAKIGTITAAFFPAWSPDGPPPPIERALQGDRSLGIGTGQGPLVGVRSTPTHLKFGKTLLASISIRYENPELPADLPPDAQNNQASGGGEGFPQNFTRFFGRMQSVQRLKRWPE